MTYRKPQLHWLLLLTLAAAAEYTGCCCIHWLLLVLHHIASSRHSSIGASSAHKWLVALLLGQCVHISRRHRCSGAAG
jgi:hypothetical protein